MSIRDMQIINENTNAGIEAVKKNTDAGVEKILTLLGKEEGSEGGILADAFLISLANDYKLHGCNGFVYNIPALREELFFSPYAANDKWMNGDALEYALVTKKITVGKWFALLVDAADVDFSGLDAIEAVADDETAMAALAASETAVKALEASSTALAALANSPLAVETSYVCQNSWTVRLDRPVFLIRIKQSTLGNSSYYIRTRYTKTGNSYVSVDTDDCYNTYSAVKRFMTQIANYTDYSSSITVSYRYIPL